MPCSARAPSLHEVPTQPLPFSGPSGSLVGLSPSCAHVSPTGFSAPANTIRVGAPVTAAAPASTSSHGGQQPQTVPTNASVSAPPHACVVLTHALLHMLTRAQMYSYPHNALLYSHLILHTHVHTHVCTHVHVDMCSHSTHSIHTHSHMLIHAQESAWHTGNMAHSITCVWGHLRFMGRAWGSQSGRGHGGLATAEPLALQPATAMATPMTATTTQRWISATPARIKTRSTRAGACASTARWVGLSLGLW